MRVDGKDYIFASGEYIVAKVSGESVSTSVSGDVVHVSSLSGYFPTLTVVNDSGAIDIFYSSQIAYQVESVTCKFTSNAIATGNFDVYVDSASGTLFDATLLSIDPSISGASSIYMKFDPPEVMTSGDAVRVSYSNLSGMGWGLRIITRIIP